MQITVSVEKSLIFLWKKKLFDEYAFQKNIIETDS